MNCIIELAMIRTSASHYRMRMVVILKCTVWMTMIMTMKYVYLDTSKYNTTSRVTIPKCNIIFF